MSWRTVVISNTAKLDYSMGYLVVRSSEEKKRIHLSEISVLVLETTSVSLTSYLLCELANQNISVVFCDQKRNPHGQYVSLYGSHDSSNKIRKQIVWEDSTKQLIWQDVVVHKILGQASVLRKNGYSSKADKLTGYASETVLGDITNREGYAAKVYFNALFGMDFSRTDKENVINAQLNYGYSILLSTVNREVISNGYLTQLGIHHDNMFNDFNLSCDLMEPFRPLIELTKEDKHNLINVLNKRIRIDNREHYITNALSIYVKSILNAIEQREPMLIKYPDYELSLYESNSDV